MEFSVVTLTSRSITIELSNDEVYFCSSQYELYLDDMKINTPEQKNIVSIFDLKPDTEYVLTLKTADGTIYQKDITTENEYVSLNVKKFGAVGDGITVDSPSIQAAIMACPEHGTVVIPRGTYCCGPLFLKSNITVELCKGAIIKGHTDREMYPILPGYITTTDESDEYYVGTWEGNPLDKHASLITGINVENVKFIGEGTIDGSGEEGDWWVNTKIKKDAWRPRTIFLNNCKNVLFQGVTVTNSPSWTIHPFFSEELDFIDLNVVNKKDSPNTDGLDPESCSNIRILGVDFSVGDDCIAIKSGKLYMGRKMKKPSSDFVIRNCRMRYGHGAVVLGSEMAGGIKNIEVKQCIFDRTDRGLRIKTRRGRGKDGIIDNIVFENIKMTEVLTPFVINMFYFCDPDGKSEYVWSKDKLPVDEWTPFLGKFEFKDIECKACEVAAGYFHGLPEQPIEAIKMKNIYVDFKEKAIAGHPAMMSFAKDTSKAGIFAENVKSLELENVTIEGVMGDRLTTENVGNIVEDGVKL